MRLSKISLQNACNMLQHRWKPKHLARRVSGSDANLQIFYSRRWTDCHGDGTRMGSRDFWSNFRGIIPMLRLGVGQLGVKALVGALKILQTDLSISGCVELWSKLLAAWYSLTHQSRDVSCFDRVWHMLLCSLTRASLWGFLHKKL